MRKSIVALILSFALLLLGQRGAYAQTEAATPARVHSLRWVSLGEWEGYSLDRHWIKSAYVSDEMRSDDGARRGKVAQLRIAGPTREWEVRCTHWRNPVSSVCDFVPNDGSTASTFVSSDGKTGWLSGQADVRMEVEDPMVIGSQGHEYHFYNRRGSKIATWEHVIALYPFEMRTYAATSAEEELAALLLLSMLPAVIGGDVSGQLDSYLLVRRPPAPDRGQAAIADWFDEQGNQPGADLLRAHIRDTRRIDVRAGAYVERYPWTPRVFMSLSGGPSVLPNPSGTPADLAGASITVSGGLKFKHLLVGAFLSLRPGEVDSTSFGQVAGNTGITSFGAAFGVQARYSLPIASDFGVGVGLAAAWRFRTLDGAGWGDLYGAMQSGFSLAPIAEVHYSIWNANKLGTRLLLVIDAMPEVQFWMKPRVDIPGGRNAAFVQALSGTDLALRTSLGLRFEL